MSGNDALREQLETKKAELMARLDRITANLRRGLEADSKERAKQMEDSEVVDALGNEAREEIAKISAALQRIESDEFGICTECGVKIHPDRLAAYPYAEECIECAEFAERRRSIP
ncbi:MAG: TraR/DksA family transcriptional regulator [Gammaproteobacteria bacterium]|nr:TraR/DksA family transcriptional regulator [Gammaproteobacteria bacterium]MDH5302680.1 TraR/DksA family transcriptional regulator [Gammaproteobacteria bacterium]MDH5320883.1 TraR/DksA family transcriptional regulator [Gammaproteobacteria bacterium]